MSESKTVHVLKTVTSFPLRQSMSLVGQKLRQQALELAEAEDLCKGFYISAMVPVDDMDGDALIVEGQRLIAPLLIPEQGLLTILACGVCTLGPRWESSIHDLFTQGRRSLAVALDDLGNEVLMAVSNRMTSRLAAQVQKMGLSMAGELRPGDPGLALDAQDLIVSLVNGQELGVTVVNGGLLHPVKSATVVFGVGKGIPAVNWSRCDYCPSRSQGRCVVHCAPKTAKEDAHV
jgi:hypothetical protein